ncbi:MAG: class I SAM-dependent methyltransferase [Thermodesulfobacteriota bacterium]
MSKNVVEFASGLPQSTVSGSNSRSLDGKPVDFLMEEEDIKAIKEELLGPGRKNIDVLEWGSGGSTVYFTEFLRQRGVNYTWISLEHDQHWYHKISEQLKGDKDIKIYLFKDERSKSSLRTADMDDYVSFPATLREKFDLILVDGRKRRRCLIEAKDLLKPGGVVLLHDAQRSYYHCAFRHYPDSRFLEKKLWRGTNVKLPIFSRITNKLNNIYYRFIL